MIKKICFILLGLVQIVSVAAKPFKINEMVNGQPQASFDLKNNGVRVDFQEYYCGEEDFSCLQECAMPIVVGVVTALVHVWFSDAKIHQKVD